MKTGTLDALTAELAGLLDRRLPELAIPGAAVALVTEAETRFISRGVTNLRHPLPVDHDTYFRIASVTKTFTALALVLALSEKGISVHAPVGEVLGRRPLSQGVDAADVTFWHLLTHTAGWDGDFPYAHVDFAALARGRGDVDTLVTAMAQARQLTDPGSLWHYNNSGFWVAALAMQRMTGQSYQDVVRRLVLDPLDMGAATFAAEDVIVRRVAAGHIERNGVLQTAEPWGWPGPAAAASGGLVATCAQLATWADWWLALSSGRRTAAAEVAEMIRPQIPGGSTCRSMGLGWMLDDIGGVPSVRHGGSAAGQQSRVTVIPDLGIGVVVLANSHLGHLLDAEVADRVADILAVTSGCDEPTLDPPSELLIAMNGSYVSTLHQFRLEAVAGRLVLTETASRPGLQRRQSPPAPATAVTMVYEGQERFVAPDGAYRGVRLEILRDRAGEIRWLRWRGRLCERVDVPS